MIKIKEKAEAISLRKRGLSYSEILKKVPAAKSTLSLWLRSVGLSRRQKQRLTEKKLASVRRGWEKWHEQRLNLTNEINLKAKSEIRKLTPKEFWLIGIGLYWAEGTKEKERNVGQGVSFNNSDPRMIKFFLRWLKEILRIKDDDIKFEIYIHENSQNSIDKVKRYWAKITNNDLDKFRYIYFKKNRVRTNRKNIGDTYYGLLRITVRKSANLNRKISGWIEGLSNFAG